MSKYWEIVQLEDGSFALQSSDESELPLVRIEFSKQAETMLRGQVADIARAMIGAGVQAANVIAESDDQTDTSTNQAPETLH